MKILKTSIISSLKESFSIISKKKLKFLFLFLVQFALIVSLSVVFLFAGLEYTNGLEASQKYFSNFQNLSAETNPEDAAYLANNYDSIMQSYNEVVASRDRILLTYLPVMIILYLILGGLGWGIANLIIDEKTKLITYMLKFAVPSILFVLASIFVGLIIPAENWVVYPAIIFALLLSYFAFVSFALAARHISIIKLLKQTFVLGVKKALTLFSSYLIILAIISLCVFFVYQSVLSLVPILFLAIILFIISLCWSKIFFILAVKKTEENC